MKISLSQNDIIAAVQAHIATQGISLAGKSVTVDFTSTRPGKTGPMAIVANVSIDNAPALPDLNEPAETVKPVLTVVASAKEPQPAAAPAPAAEPAPTNEPAAVDPEPVAGNDDTATVKTTSLFA